MLSGAARAGVIEGLTLLAGVIWLWAGLAKVRRPLTRADVAAVAPWLGEGYAVVRFALPVLELAVGLALLTGTGARAAGWVGAGLAWTFAALHTVAMVRAGLADAPVAGGCGCFGGSGAGQRRAAVAGAAPAGAVLDLRAVQSRGWDLARAALLAIATWVAVLPCPFCSG